MSHLWLSGISGCGKFVLSSTIVADIQTICARDPDRILAYFYFDFNDAKMLDPQGRLDFPSPGFRCFVSRHHICYASFFGLLSMVRAILAIKPR